jgi:hypothetical protein
MQRMACISSASHYSQPIIAGLLPTSSHGLLAYSQTEADDIGGYVVRYVFDKAGKHLIDGDQVVTEKLRGIVEIFGTKRRWANQ